MIASPAKKKSRRQIVKNVAGVEKPAWKSRRGVRKVIQKSSKSKLSKAKVSKSVLPDERTWVSKCDGGEMPGNQSFLLQQGIFE